MLEGEFLVGRYSDQYTAGYSFRVFGAEMFRATGSIPEWNPYLFGGLPFIAAMHGDIFYPTAWMRWILPVDTAMNLGFALHLVLAGGLMYAFLRALRLTWTAAIFGGLAYELTGIVASLVHPGHDGKLYVSALSPLAFLALLLAVRHRQIWGYGLLALTVGLAMLSPHYQMTYYLLVALGIWTLYLTFFDLERPHNGRWFEPLGLALAAVVLGTAISAIQAVPFLEYIPYSPRGAGGASGGWEYATSYSMPPEELLATLIPQFSGVIENYWGRNYFKLHTEYLGVAVLLAAAFAWGDTRRRSLLKCIGGIGILFLLVSLGGHTPFYRVWYEVMPMMKKVRAPGMAFYLVALPVVVFAAVGVDRLLRREVRWSRIGVAVGALAAIGLLGTLGGLQTVAQAVAQPQQAERLVANAEALRAGSLRLLVVVAAVAAVLWGIVTGRLRMWPAAVALTLVVVGDLWSIDRLFFRYSPGAATLFADDEITRHLKQVKPPFRVYDHGVYERSFLMAYHLQSLLGYHGNELRYYDDLMGGKNVWRNVGSPNLFDLLAVRFLVLPQEQQVPGFHGVLGPITTTPGTTGFLYEQDSLPPYVRVVAAAARIPEDQIVPTVVDPRFPPNNVVLYPETTSVKPAPISGGIPARSAVKADLVEWAPGKMHIALTGSDPAPAYLLISETWYPKWLATVDGRTVPVHRADHALLSVVIPPGARDIRLVLHSDSYQTGKLITGVALILTAAFTFGPLLRRGRKGA